MTPQRWARMKEIFGAALEKPGLERPAYLDFACRGDAELRAEVERLLEEGDATSLHSPAGSFLNAGRELAPGEMVAHYRIEVKLGEGGMGVVYQARDTKLERQVAIKILPDVFARDPERLVRFEREAKVLAALNHPGIAQIYGIENGAIVMELVDGKHLEGPLPLDTALNYAGQIADALECAHDKGIVHRDLKPVNIKVTADGRQVKILDFGLAKFSDPIASDGIRATGHGTILGTTAYMAPEQACGQAVDRRADIWAFGVVLWEMLTGKRLFEGGTFSEVVAAVLRNEPDLDAIPASVRPVVAACLERDPRKRLSAAGDWRRLVRDEAPQVPRHAGWLPWTAVAVALAAAAAIGLALRPGTRIPAPLMIVTEDSPVPLSIRGHGPAIALSPDGSRVVYRNATRDGRTCLTVRRLDQPTPTNLPGTDNTDSMFFSSDSRWVGYVTDEGMFKVGVDGGARSLLCTTCTGVRGVAWGGDGSLIYGSLQGPLFRLPASGGQPVELTKLENGELSHRWPTLSPDGSVVVFAFSRSEAHDEYDALTALSLNTGKRSDLHTPGTFPRFLGAGDLLFVNAGSLYKLPLDRGLRPAGASQRLLTDVASVLRTGGSQFTMSDTGIAAYIPGYIDQEHLMLSWVSAEGKLSPVPPPAAYVAPRLSPDARKVAVRLNSPKGPDFHVLDLERGAMTRVTFDAKGKSAGAIWTPDGRFLVFGSEASGPGIYSVRSDGSGTPRKIMETLPGVSAESFSRDGQWLLLTAAGKVSAAPAVITMDGVRLGKAGTLFKGESPRFSPNGRWVVYQFYQSGMSQIFARRFPGSEATYQISTRGGRNPVWPLAGQLFFTSNGIATVKCAEQGDSLQCDAPRQWSQLRLSRSPTPSFDGTSDGRVLVLTPPTEANAALTRVNFLFNFGASAVPAGTPQ